MPIEIWLQVVGHVKICVLGPLSLRISGSTVTPSALNSNHFVSVADLYAELWQEHLPPSAKATLQGYVVQLRKILAGQAGCEVVTRPGGYLMRVDQGVLDLQSFEEALTEARRLQRTGQDEPAVRAFLAALAMRRGLTLADIEPGPVLEPSIMRITQACNSAIEQLMGCELRLGRHLDILDELSELILRNPLHEGLHARFMIALYRSGRRSTAIDAYERLRRAVTTSLALIRRQACADCTWRSCRTTPCWRSPRPLVRTNRSNNSWPESTDRNRESQFTNQRTGETMSSEETQRYDVIVIGAGPGGSTTAAKLAQLGHSVLLLERRSLPRFHIGESMLPTMNVICEQLGVWERIKEQGFVPKYGAEFSRAGSGKYGRVPFTAQGPGRHSQTYQVERAHFDKTLADFAAECGAALLENANVEQLLVEGDRVTGVRYRHDGAEHVAVADYVVDASGRASQVSQQFSLRKYVERMRMVAVFRHYKGLQERNNPGETGDIMIGSHQDGWLWAIPIWPDTISVGSVMKRDVLRGSTDHAALLDEHVNRIERISQRIADCEPHGDIHIETDYCYYSDQIAGQGWFMVGDAACFFDPIFSGGTFLAMATGYVCAETIHEVLADPGRTDALQLHYSNFYKTGYDLYARIIYAYYEGGFNVRHYLVSIAAALGGGDWFDNKWVVRQFCGDFWSEHNLLNAALIKETRWDTFAPFERAWGCPFYPEQADAGQDTPELQHTDA